MPLPARTLVARGLPGDLLAQALDSVLACADPQRLFSSPAFSPDPAHAPFGREVANRSLSPKDASEALEETKRAFANSFPRAWNEWVVNDNRLVFSRTAILTAAIAAEAYANFYLAAHLTEVDVDALDRLPIVDKLVTGVRLAAGKELFVRGRAPLQDLAVMFKARNALVHPKPRRVSADTASLIEPFTAARSVVAVSEVALALAMTCGRDADAFLAYTPLVVLEHRSYLLELGRRAASEVPQMGGPPPLALTDAQAHPPLRLREYLERTGWQPVTEEERGLAYGWPEDYGVDESYDDEDFDEDQQVGPQTA